MAKDCAKYYRDQIKAFIKTKVNVANATYTDKQIFIPYGKDKIKTLASARATAARYSNEINQRFQGFNVTSVDRSMTNGAGINIHIPFKLIQQYLLKQDEQQWRNDEANFDMDFFSPEDNVHTITPDFTRFRQFQENLVQNLESRRAMIRRRKNQDLSLSKEDIKKLTAEEARITKLLEGDKDEFGMFARLDSLKTLSTLDELSFYLDKDFSRMQSLYESSNPADLAEAGKLREFFESLGSFDPKEDHIFFSKEIMYNTEGELLIENSVVEKFKKYKDAAVDIRNKNYLKEKNTVLQNVNNNSRVKNTFKGKKFDYKELFYEDGGLKDASWVDMFVMDTTNGIFSHNGIIPQVCMSVLQDAIESNLVHAKVIENDINNIIGRLEKEIKKFPGQDLSAMGINGVSYDMFRARDKYGNFKDAVIQRFTETFGVEERDVKKKFFSKFNEFLFSRNKSVLRQAYTNRNLWYRTNSHIIEVGALPEIQEDPKFASFSKLFNTNSNHKQELISQIGENAYNEMVAQQKAKLKSYMEHHANEVDSRIVEEGAASLEDLSDNGKFLLSKWETENNPLIFSSKVGQDLSASGTMRYNITVPRRKAQKVTIKGKERIFTETDNDTGYWDKNFEAIDNNATLKEFHDIILKFQRTIFDVLPVDVRKKFNSGSLPALEKTIVETLFDKNNTFGGVTSASSRQMYEKIQSMFGENIMESASYNKVNPVTGKVEHKVNDNFLKTNSKEIKERYGIEMARLKTALGVSQSKAIKKDEVFNIIGNTDSQNILAEITGNKSFAKLQQSQPNVDFSKLELTSYLNSIVTHQVVQEKSFNLPKMLKLFSFLAMEYAGRQEALPLVNLLKSHYEEIKAPETNKDGKPLFNIMRNKTQLEGERARANKQMDSWFQRAVLGNYSSKNELGDTKVRRAASIATFNKPEEEKKWWEKLLSTVITGRIMNKDEKLTKMKLDEIEKNLKAEIENPNLDPMTKEALKKRLEYFTSQKDKLGKDFTVSHTLDSLFNFIRLKGLGWNLSSGVTNFMEGQTSNFTIAASGKYFTPENIYRAVNIVKGSFLRTASLGKATTKEAKKLSILMNRYRVLQDAANELQKASTNTSFSKLQNLSPYELTKRVEYLNQAPLLIAIMMDQKIVGVDGQEGTLWDAIDENGEMLPEFATEENKQNWEKANGQNYNDLKSKVTKTIVNAHGDYDQLRGNLSSEYMTGKAMMMFKRWMSRQFYQRFATAPQADIEAGVAENKGRYLSHTASSGFLHGALIGFGGLSFFSFGPLGALLGAGLGVGLGKFYGANSGLPFFHELSLVAKETFMNLIRIPVNTISGKPRIKTNAFNGMLSEQFSETDLQNYRANLIDMSLLLGSIAMLLLTKAAFFDEDDEEDSTRRKVHNALANRFMQLSSQATQYLNPIEAYKGTIGEIAIMQFLTNVSKTAMEAGDMLAGKDILAGGPHAGESAFLTQAKKTFLPGVFKANLGFEAQMQREFVPSKFNDWFKTQELLAKESSRRYRAAYRAELNQGEDLTKKQIETAVNRKFRPKKEKESYIDLIRAYEAADR